MARTNLNELADPVGVDTTLSDVLGDHPKVRILTVLLSESGRDLNPSEIARIGGIDRSTFYEHKDDLLAYGVMEQTRTVGNSPMYQIDRENEAAKALGKLDHALMDIFAAGGVDGELDE